MTKEVDDPLKPLDEVFKPDIRSTWMQIDDESVGIRPKTLRDHHAAISGIRLSDEIPRAVRQLMETAKNLVLYSWFCYRFHQPAELVAYGSLEMALRERAKATDPTWLTRASQKGKPPPLGELLKKAWRDKWIKNEGFENWRHAQRYRAWQKEIWRITEEMSQKGIQQYAIPDQAAFDGMVGDESFDYVAILTGSIPALRNDIAHGATTLHPNSLGTLRICAEAINQLFWLRTNQGE